MIMNAESLICGIRSNGKLYARPIGWEGVYDENGLLEYGNTLYETNNIEELKAFCKKYRKENGCNGQMETIQP